MTDVKTQAGTLKVEGGKDIITENTKGFKDGEAITVFKNSEVCDFKYAKEGSHVKHGFGDKTVKMHVLDAAIAQAMNKGKIVEGSAKKYAERAKK